jgi:DNA-binding beta-propeller fold protein YncE
LVTLYGTSQIASYTGFNVFDQPTGVEMYAAGANPIAVVADGTSRYVYVTDSGLFTTTGYHSAILGFSMTPASAVLTPLATPSFASGARPNALAADPTGTFLFAACEGVPPTVAGALSAYTIGTGGSLIPIASEPGVGSSPRGVAIVNAWQ